MTENVIPQTHFEIDVEKTHATLTIGKETVVLDAQSLENFIVHLGVLRAQLVPAVPQEFPANGQFLQLMNPILEVRFPEEGKMAALILRTPNYGWIGYHLHPVNAVGAARLLLSTFEPPSAG